MTDQHQSRLAVLEQKQQHFEQKQDEMKQTQEGIIRDMKETSSALRQLSTDISVLVTNVTHLTKAVEKINESTNTMREVEIELVSLRTETRTVRKLWEEHDKIKAKVNSQNIIIRGIQVVASAAGLGLIGITIAKLFGE